MVTADVMSRTPTSVASQRIADVLAGRILSGELAPGARIKQDELAEELATSRIPVRDALRILESRGLVTMRANAGARVASLSLHDLAMSYEIRERLEPLLLADSIPHLSKADIAEMFDVLERLEAVSDLDEAVALGRKFHWITYRGHRSALLAQLVERVWDTTQSYRRAYLAMARMRGGGSVEAEHRMLAEAIARGEVEIAQATLVLHIRRARNGLDHGGGLQLRDKAE
ncbi:MAG: GntR family transcriptional regulator [Novosphingobium sp.]|nr:GntR family transcriptional regulator [Novosphingobium sp.]